jgi:hypothetical protein
MIHPNRTVLAGRNASIAAAVTPALNKRFYYSNLYGNEAGLLKFKTITSTIQKALPRAKIGANFSPLHFFTDPRDGVQYCQMWGLHAILLCVRVVCVCVSVCICV